MRSNILIKQDSKRPLFYRNGFLSFFDLKILNYIQLGLYIWTYFPECFTSCRKNTIQSGILHFENGEFDVDKSKSIFKYKLFETWFVDISLFISLFSLKVGGGVTP